MTEIPSQQGDHAKEDADPRLVAYENGDASALVVDQEGDQITIGGYHKYFQDPNDSPTSILRVTAERDDGTMVDSFVTESHVVVVRRYEGQKPDIEIILKSDEDPADVALDGKVFSIGEPVNKIPGYSRGGMTLKAVAAEYKMGVAAQADEVREAKSPFNKVRELIEQRREWQARKLGAGTSGMTIDL